MRNTAKRLGLAYAYTVVGSATHSANAVPGHRHLTRVIAPLPHPLAGDVIPPRLVAVPTPPKCPLLE
jgi:hypothetical protein